MKRFLSLLLLAAVMTAAVSCIRLEDLPQKEETTKQTDLPTESQSQTETETEPPLPPAPVWKGAEQSAAHFFTAANTVVDSSKREYSYEEMQADLQILQARYPDQLSYRTFGKSVAGRELYVVTLGNPKAEQCVLVSAGIHGREYLTPLLVMKQIEFYLTYYHSGSYNGSSYKDLFDKCCFYIVPMTNPDGIMLSQQGLSSLSDSDQKKIVEDVYRTDFKKEYTSQEDINEYLKYWKANANGVDLNRNFDALWEDYKMGEKEPCHKSYKGPSPASEPETKALAALTDSLPTKPAAVLCIHSQGEVLYWNCGQSPALLSSTRAFTAALADRTGYKLVEEQNNDASFSDWCALEKGLIAVTVETGKGTCPLFIDKFEDIWFDNYDLLPLTARYFLH